MDNSTSINELLSCPIFEYFYQICQIPHGSGNEYQLGNWIVQWAKIKGLDAIQDRVGNVLVRKKSPNKYPNVKNVLLQAHLDMVCAKDPNYEHDFMKDPIKWVIEDDMLSTGHLTTLGADNGIGVAIAMAMFDEELPSINIEALFTVGEEDDFRGASFFDYDQLESKIMINLDHSDEKEILCGSCGGMKVNFILPIFRKPIPSSWKAFHLEITGLIGGHSGKDIALGHGNANVVLMRIIDFICTKSECMICNIIGGTFRLSIPRNAEATVCLPENKIDCIMKDIDNFFTCLKKEFSIASDLLSYRFNEVPVVKSGIEPEKIIKAMLLIPDGIFQMSESLPGQVTTSDNLGEVYLRDDYLEMVLEIRSEQESLREYLFRRMELLAELLGGKCYASNIYPSWYYNVNSSLASICKSAHEMIYGYTPILSEVHAGLEVGYFYEKIEQLDAVSIGPNIWSLHSSEERVSISSVHTFYNYLKRILMLLSKSS